MDITNGVYVVVDGQFGSTGKGLIASWFAEKFGHHFSLVTSNAGPNSGHTSYGPNDEKVVLKQLPTMAVMERKFNKELNNDSIPIYLNAGAIINPDILNKEVAEHDVDVILHRNAVLVRPEDLIAEGSGTVREVAGTRQGGGSALARKVLRDPLAVVSSYQGEWHPKITISDDVMWEYDQGPVFMEVSQGFSLGIHSQFYPKVTSRECTVSAAFADARCHPHHLRHTIMVIRTYPIRVGNHEGFSSGDCYPDQEEASWNGIGIAPELTTVTLRPRRIFTFSVVQYKHALVANRPDTIFVNFMNYIDGVENRQKFATHLAAIAQEMLGFTPRFLWGYGPRNKDVLEYVV
jgi:adenylosuccinate synthase